MTHRHFESIFHSLLSHYAMELEMSVNKWTGHSFRSGLPALLQSLGFSDEEIKAWGRWASSAFQLYARDIFNRFEVQSTILSLMDKIKAHVEGVAIKPNNMTPTLMTVPQLMPGAIAP